MCKKTYFFFFFAFFTRAVYAQLSEGIIASYYFTGNAKENVSGNYAIVRGAALATDRFGNANSAYCFDGVNDLINLGTRMDLKQVKMSISLWSKINSYNTNSNDYPNQPFIFTKSRDAKQNYEAYFIGVYMSNNKFDAANTSSLQQQIASISKVSAEINEWYHIIYMFDTDTTFLYVNGILQQKNYKGFFTSYLESDSVVLGYAGDKWGEGKYCWLNGCLDDIKIYNRLLSQEEISELYIEPNPLYGIKNEPSKNEIDFKELLKKFWYLPAGFLMLLLLTLFIIRWRIKYIINRDKEKNDLQQQLVQMEMQALRNQMNPHFIFNAINSIQHYVLTNEKELANKYLVKFSKLIRNVLELSKQELITLKDELETIKLYVEIESLRFDDAFDFVLNVQEDINDNEIKIPPLIIQPFVENAIWHGLLLKKGKKELTINVSYKDFILRIEIDDNGIGRKASSEFKNAETPRKSFGMEITQSRLNVFEKTYRISTTFEVMDKMSELNAPLGTNIIITMKLKTESV